MFIALGQSNRILDRIPSCQKSSDPAFRPAPMQLKEHGLRSPALPQAAQHQPRWLSWLRGSRYVASDSLAHLACARLPPQVGSVHL
jgi:hypothetical protein